MVYSRKVIHYAGTRMNLCQKFSKIIFQGPYIFFLTFPHFCPDKTMLHKEMNQQNSLDFFLAVFTSLIAYS